MFNFSAGPAVLPESVLRQIADEIVSLPGVGSSILEISHRSPEFTEYLNRAREGLRTLLNVPSDYEILFLQGGSRLQFSMIPMNFLHADRIAAYLVTGSWGQMAFKESQLFGESKALFDGQSDGFQSVPTEPYPLDPEKYAYSYFVSNETIQGVQFSTEPDCGDVPLVCDASSDFLHRPIDVSRYGMIYACAQKNAGPAGLTIVIAKRDLIEQGKKELPGYLEYRSHVKAGSLFNTPPTFAIYVFSLIVEWLEREMGGLEKMYQRNQEKAKLLYDVIDQYPDFYIGHPTREHRSLMNVVFNLADNERLPEFLSRAEAIQCTGMAGHRSVGGVRISIYNAMPIEGIQRVADFMTEFVNSKS